MSVERRMRLRNHHQQETVLVAPALSSASAYPFDAAPFGWIWHAQQWHSARPSVLRRRAAILALVAWFPLVLVTAVQRGAGNMDSWLTPLLDVRILSRFLIALPVLVIAEPVFVARLSGIAMHFQRAGFVRRADTARFSRILARSRVLLSHHFVEVVILLITLGFSFRLLSPGTTPAAARWQLQRITENPRLSADAHWWLALVSQPLFLIWVARWVWRSCVWSRTLRCIARLDLSLVPAHPDRAGGLLFVAQSIAGLAPLGFALACGLAGALAGSTSPQPFTTMTVTGAMGALLGVMLIVAIGPLCWLTAPMRTSQLRGIVEYGELAVRFGRRFEARWLRERRSVSSDALSAPDFSATIDLYSVVSAVYTVRIVPVKARSLFKLVASIVIPFLPVLLSLMPVQDLVHFAAKLLL
ncbi:MAG TPA: hypothetical protein VF461_13990 [Gemmatimonadaceae bacterium]